MSFRNPLSGTRLLAGAVAIIMSLAGATTAFAEDSASLQGYGGPGGGVQGTVDQGGTLPTQDNGAPAPTGGGNEVLGVQQGGGNLPDEASNQPSVLGDTGAGGNLPEQSAPAAAAAPRRLVGSLPFTGLDLALLAAAGIGLAGLGLGLRRLTGGTPQAG
jgi:hypothetical protein